ncbi:MAG: hypothetical protein IKA84_01510 [Clostridia bacterium]|nr:hypothetical protein [Clostridia bacterium]
MLKNKNTLIVFIFALIAVALGACIALQASSIKEMKTANGEAQERIDALYGHIDTLDSELDDTANDVEKYKSELEKNKDELEKNKSEVEKNKQEIKKYQEILNAWNTATPKVRGAIERVTGAYEVLMNDAFLYPNGALDGCYDTLMDTVYAIIRSTDPQKLADEYLSELDSLDSNRFDLVLKSKIDSVKENGVLFPEDVAGYEDALAYYSSFANNPTVLDTFADKGLVDELSSVFAALDTDEEKDLAKAFVDEVSAVELPITLATSLKTAIYAWNDLMNALEEEDTLDEETLEARELLDSYIKRMEELAVPSHNCAECIRAKLCELLAAADEATRAFLDEIAREVEAWLEVLNFEEAVKCLERAVSELCFCPCATN